MKKVFLKRTLALLLSAGLLVSSFAACSSSTENETDDDTFEIAYISPSVFEDGGWGTSQTC